ncbi:MAG: ATP-binding cassette domain-containing protein [Pseudomonadota bacterium]|nr:MAG: ATP-binding cassette domain-containing protein [Pseudomonadota bacterium]
MPESGLRLEQIGHRFGPTAVVEDIDLCLHAGRCAALVGPSGCGKTTLLRIAAGLLEPESGRMTSRFERPACVFQEPRLLPWRRAEANIALGLEARGVGRHEAGRRARALGQRVGLNEDALTRYPHELSGGMRQRVALARALAIDPDLLLLDEPFSALDIGLRFDLQNLLLAELRERGTAALLVTHDLREALRLADELVVLTPEPGRVVMRMCPDRPRRQRDGDWLQRNLSGLLAEPAVAGAFGLPLDAHAVLAP